MSLKRLKCNKCGYTFRVGTDLGIEGNPKEVKHRISIQDYSMPNYGNKNYEALLCEACKNRLLSNFIKIAKVK